MNNLVLAATYRRETQAEKAQQIKQSKIYEQQNINFANFILNLSKKGGKQ